MSCATCGAPRPRPVASIVAAAPCCHAASSRRRTRTSSRTSGRRADQRLRQAEALGELRRRLDLQRAREEEAVVGRRRAAEAVERGKERVQEQIERVLPLSRALTAAYQRVQVLELILLWIRVNAKCSYVGFGLGLSALVYGNLIFPR